jgi:hypothetical protein
VPHLYPLSLVPIFCSPPLSHLPSLDYGNLEYATLLLTVRARCGVSFDDKYPRSWSNIGTSEHGERGTVVACFSILKSEHLREKGYWQRETGDRFPGSAHLSFWYRWVCREGKALRSEENISTGSTLFCNILYRVCGTWPLMITKCTMLGYCGTPFNLLHWFIFDSTSRHYNLSLQWVLTPW